MFFFCGLLYTFLFFLSPALESSVPNLLTFRRGSNFVFLDGPPQIFLFFPHDDGQLACTFLLRARALVPHGLRSSLTVPLCPLVLVSSLNSCFDPFPPLNPHTHITVGYFTRSRGISIAPTLLSAERRPDRPTPSFLIDGPWPPLVDLHPTIIGVIANFKHAFLITTFFYFPPHLPPPFYNRLLRGRSSYLEL